MYTLLIVYFFFRNFSLPPVVIMSTSQSGSEFPTGIDQQNKKFTTIIIYPTGKI